MKLRAHRLLPPGAPTGSAPDNTLARRSEEVPQRIWSRAKWLVVLLTLLAAALVLTELQRPSYWIDEKVSVDAATGDSPLQIINNVIQAERRPPAYHLGLWIWLKLTGSEERLARLYSAWWVVLLVPVTFQLARGFADERSAAWAAMLAATAPVLIAYGQIIRYYSMVAALSALSFALFWRVMQRERKPWIAYAGVTLLLLYTDYPAFGVVAAQNVLALLWWRSRPHHPRWKWFALQAGLGVAVLAWTPVVLTQGTRDFGAADLSNSLVGALLRAAYPFYAWIAGENIFPWTPWAFCSLIVGGLLALLGAFALWRRRQFGAWLVAFGLPFIVSQALLSTVATDSPFVNAPARSMACAALLIVLLGIGLGALKSRWLISAALIGLIVPHAVSALNYYRGTDFINSVYNTPAREVAEAIATQARPGDVIVTESDSMIEFYLPAVYRATHFYPQQLTEIQAYLAAHADAAVWQAMLGRDRTRTDVPAHVSEILQQERRLCATAGFAEQDSIYRQFKTRLIGRAAYQYRVTLQELCP
jgi:uncharacterized membrane protein